MSVQLEHSVIVEFFEEVGRFWLRKYRSKAPARD